MGERLGSAARTVGTLGLLLVPLPANLALTAVALARRSLTHRPRPTTGVPRTVLISGGKMTKALALARAFDRAGHRVILIESARYRLTGHRFSRAVDRFFTVPDPGSPGYLDALIDLVRREGVDVFVPVSSPASAHHEAAAREALAPWCEVVHGTVDDIDRVDDKYRFSTTAVDLGLPTPGAERITDPEQVVAATGAGGPPWVLKSIAYDPVNRLDLTPLPRATPEATRRFAAGKPISAANPWVLQRFVAGQEYCTHSTVRNGRVQLHCCCRSSSFQLNYEMVDVPEIEAWVRRFVGALRLTGQYSFDFIEDGEGTFHAIECNPRTHSAITMFYDHPDVHRAYLEDGVDTLTPLPTSRPTYWTYWELWRLLRHPRSAPERLRTLRHGRDAVFDWDDPLPFLLLHHLHIPALLVGNLRSGRNWLRIDFNIGKLVEPAGD